MAMAITSRAGAVTIIAINEETMSTVRLAVAYVLLGGFNRVTTSESP
jgi:hypothetical protein